MFAAFAALAALALFVLLAMLVAIATLSALAPRTALATLPYDQMVIARVGMTMRARPAAARLVRRSPKTARANAIETRIESLSIWTTTLTWPVCTA